LRTRQVMMMVHQFKTDIASAFFFSFNFVISKIWGSFPTELQN
jgi:hypothetical protein